MSKTASMGGACSQSILWTPGFVHVQWWEKLLLEEWLCGCPPAVLPVLGVVGPVCSLSPGDSLPALMRKSWCGARLQSQGRQRETTWYATHFMCYALTLKKQTEYSFTKPVYTNKTCLDSPTLLCFHTNTLVQTDRSLSLVFSMVCQFLLRICSALGLLVCLLLV